jgi:3-deoxy-7-phosphoheptulonate synthase
VSARIIRLTAGAAASEVQATLQGLGLWTQTMASSIGEPPALVVAPHSCRVDRNALLALTGVADVLEPPSAHPRVDAQANRGVQAGPVRIGGGAPAVLIAGPCGVESEEQIHAAAALSRAAGASLLRGGAFKPRTSPYSFSGHGRPALRWLREAADAYGLGVVTEVTSETEVDAIAAVADVLQVGARSMQAFSLLKAIGGAGKPVLLKRGMAAGIEEWLLAGEHLLAAGASGVIFCERGVSGTDSSTRYLLDLAAAALMKHVHGQPIVVDPSHGTGRRDLILPLSRAALAAGADGILVEAHPDARQARSDGPQALPPGLLRELGALFETRRSDEYRSRQA